MNYGGGECGWEGGGQDGVEWGGKWDNCNSIINKYINKKVKKKKEMLLLSLMDLKFLISSLFAEYSAIKNVTLWGHW